MRYANLAERLFYNSVLDQATGCWLWIGKISRKGYGHMTKRVSGVGPRNRMAHRVAYEELRGEKIPDELTLDHLCRNTRCINPAHMEVVSRAENSRRMNAERATSSADARSA